MFKTEHSAHTLCGKTFVALDLAAHISEGLDWHGRGTQLGYVVYIDVRRRLDAALQVGNNKMT